MKLRNLLTASLIAATISAAQMPVYGQTDTTTTTTKKVVIPAHVDVVTTTTTKKKTFRHKEIRKETSEEIQLRELKESLAAQQAQIDALKSQLATKDGQLTTTQQTATDAAAQAAAAQAAASAAAASAASDAAKINAVSSSVSDLKSTTTGLTETIVKEQTMVKEALESPATVHYKGVTITPAGFAAAETIFRTRTMNSNISTPFSSTPYMNSANAHVTEFNGSAQQSRFGATFTTPNLSFGKASAYFEADFLGAGTTSNSNQTNSYLLRIREYFGGMTTKSGFTFQGGQMFVLATESKKGAVQAQGTESTPQTIDPQYHVGFNFARQYELRFVQSMFADKLNVAVALDQAQIVLAGTTNAPDNFFIGGQGSTGGLFNSTGSGSAAQNYTNNIAPDIIAKVTLDSGGHYEIGGIVRFFRDRVYQQTNFCTTVSTTAGNPCVAANTSSIGNNFTTIGGGFFASARIPVKTVSLGAKISAGDGTGRYGTSNLGDVTVRPSGLLEPLRDAQGLGEVIFHVGKKLDIIGMAGFEYLQRTTYQSPTTPGVPTSVQVGYGGIQGQNDTGCSTQLPPTTNSGYAFSAGGSCSGATRVVEAATGGFIYRIYNSPAKGRFQFETLYTNLEKKGWAGYTAGSSFATATAFGTPKATNNIVYTSFRYYLP